MRRERFVDIITNDHLAERLTDSWIHWSVLIRERKKKRKSSERWWIVYSDGDEDGDSDKNSCEINSAKNFIQYDTYRVAWLFSNLQTDAMLSIEVKSSSFQKNASSKLIIRSGSLSLPLRFRSRMIVRFFRWRSLYVLHEKNLSLILSNMKDDIDSSWLPAVNSEHTANDPLQSI